jgi:nucleoside-diphosphate-sugar epimerase
MKYSIYGGTGFIGGNFCRMYSDSSLPVSRDERNPLTNKVIYFISTVHNYNVYDNLHLDIDTNLKVLMDVLEKCKNKDIVFNFISSWFVYGRSRLPARESDSCDPTGFYSITKRAAEQLLISFCETFDVKYRILRLSNVYGQGDEKSSAKKNAIQYMIDLLKKGEDINLYEGGYVLRDLMHVKDVCRAIKFVCDNGEHNAIYNIGSGKPVAIRAIMEKAKEHLNSPSKFKSIDTPKFHDIVQSRDFYLDVSKLNELGFSPQISLDEGIKELCL